MATLLNPCRPDTQAMYLMTVQLRGELPSQDLIDALVNRTQQIHGVRDVESLLHLTGTEAPMHS